MPSAMDTSHIDFMSVSHASVHWACRSPACRSYCFCLRWSMLQILLVVVQAFVVIQIVIQAALTSGVKLNDRFTTLSILSHLCVLDTGMFAPLRTRHCSARRA
eukprot:5373809-Amphidinium_carterae.1